jgi:hypothetical protein
LGREDAPGVGNRKDESGSKVGVEGEAGPQGPSLTTTLEFWSVLTAEK